METSVNKIAYNINLKAVHVRGADNIVCDKLSRFQSTSDWMVGRGYLPQPMAIPSYLKPINFEIW